MTPGALSYAGPPIDDPATLARLPDQLRDMLERVNGFTQHGGVFHVRSACREPAWHALASVWDGPAALSATYRTIRAEDIPFGQDALGNQYLLREGRVCCLDSETGRLRDLDLDLHTFLAAVEARPFEVLKLQMVQSFWSGGRALQPGNLLNVYPPLCASEAGAGISVRPVPVVERLGMLALIAEQVQRLPDGARLRIKVR